MRWAKRMTPGKFPINYARLLRIGKSQADAFGEGTVDMEYRGTLKEMLRRADDFRHYRKCLRDHPSFEECFIELNYRLRVEKFRAIDETWGLRLRVYRKPDPEKFSHLLK
jgi:glucan biosynthesis protein